MIELYFEITNEKAINDYNDWEKDDRAINDIFKIIVKELGIDTDEYAKNLEKLTLRLNGNDVERFKKSLISGSTTEFKKSSKESKRWRELLCERQVKRSKKPSMWDYLPTGIGRMSSSFYKLNDRYYGYYSLNGENADYILKSLPVGFTVIKAWEYHKAIDEYNEKILSKRASE